MNPGYAGRSNLPDNLKKLFRSVAMTKPDKELITQVMLYSQGFQTAKKLATRIVPFFDECLQDLSQQTHYDFGLRALKSVLVTSGNLKRARYQEGYVETNVGDSEEELEAKLILQALHETVSPKLVGDDVQRLIRYLFLDENYANFQNRRTRIPWSGLRAGAVDRVGREDQVCCRRPKPCHFGPMDHEDFATLSDSEHSSRCYDGWGIGNWKVNGLEDFA